MAAEQVHRYPASVQAMLDTMADTDRLKQIADFKITCDDREWDVHRFVIFMHSPVLATACSKDFKEAEMRAIDLSHDEPLCVAAMINFFYKLDYDTSELPLEECALSFHVKMCIIADKYGVTTLQDLATEKFLHCLQAEDWPEGRITETAKLAYDALAPTKDIRAEIIRYAIHEELSLLSENGHSRPFETFMRQCAELATDLTLAVWKARPTFESQAKVFKCPNGRCDEKWSVCADLQQRGTPAKRKRIAIPAVHPRMICSTCGTFLQVENDDDGGKMFWL